jgi:hypothetical protein
MKETSLIIIETEATNSKIAIALNKQGILLSTIKYPRLPIWFESEISLLHKHYDTVSFKTLSVINNVKKIFDGSKVILYEYTGEKQETF